MTVSTTHLHHPHHGAPGAPTSPPIHLATLPRLLNMRDEPVPFAGDRLDVPDRAAGTVRARGAG